MTVRYSTYSMKLFASLRTVRSLGLRFALGAVLWLVVLAGGGAVFSCSKSSGCKNFLMVGAHLTLLSMRGDLLTSVPAVICCYPIFG